MDVHRGRGEGEDGFDTITVDGWHGAGSLLRHDERRRWMDSIGDVGIRRRNLGDDDTVLAAAERGLSKYHERATTGSCSMRTR